MRRPCRPRLAELSVRLARLRTTSNWLTICADLGRLLRLELTDAGSPTWQPAEDLSWRSWIERQGDEYARDLLAAVDEMLEKRAAGFEAADGAVRGSEEVRRVPAGDQTVPKRAR